MSLLNFINIGLPEIIILILVYIFFLVLIFYVLRLILSIPKILKQLDRQNQLLTEIAKKQGVSEDTISGIENSTR